MERYKHISRADAVYAAISGALLGTAPWVLPIGGIGLTVGALGLLRMRSREIDEQLTHLSEYLDYLAPNKGDQEKSALKE